MRRYSVAEEPRNGMRGSLLQNASLITAYGNGGKNSINS